jgi:hypothetical protein
METVPGTSNSVTSSPTPRLRCHRRPFDATQCSVMTTRP